MAVWRLAGLGRDDQFPSPHFHPQTPPAPCLFSGSGCLFALLLGFSPHVGRCWRAGRRQAGGPLDMGRFGLQEEPRKVWDRLF
jgi:hypothetical protein